MKRFSSGGCYADITPKERAIANGQRSFASFLLLQLSNCFLRILAVPNKAVFCNSPVLIVTPSFSSHVSNLLLTTPNAPTTTGTTSRCLIPHSLPISLLMSWYFSIFSPSFSYTLWCQGEAMSTTIALLFYFSTATMSALLASITYGHTGWSHPTRSYIFHFPLPLPFPGIEDANLTSKMPLFFSCSDIDECSIANDCYQHATCHNTKGSYNCICKNGFKGDGRLNCTGKYLIRSSHSDNDDLSLSDNSNHLWSRI